MPKSKSQSINEAVKANRLVCPNAYCRLQFRLSELFAQHVKFGCKPAKSDGPTWSEKSAEDEPHEPVQEQTEAESN